MLITKKSAIFKHYLTQGFFFDFAVIIFSFLSLVYSTTNLVYLFVAKIFRFYKLKVMMEKIEDFLNFSRRALAMLKMVRLMYTLVIVAHWIACIFHLLAA